MQIETAWVKPPPQVGGLDPLAVQAPCINIYGRLLPGITNVTDRARYYSFYPWLIWACDQAGYTKYDDEFIERFRRADCLFCLIAQRHAASVGGEPEDHSAAVVGSDTLAAVARSLDGDGTVRLSDYSLREGAKARYFANRLGGLGQYYLGVLRELALLDGDTRSGIRYSRQVGQVIAERMDACVDRDLFMRIVDADMVSAAELDALSGFCPCQLAGSPDERQILGELFFVRGLFHDSEALPRRRTLQSILQLGGLLADVGEELSEAAFRTCAYTGSLPGGAPWTVTASLAGNRQRWAVYARNELLSVAVQGLFFALLDAYQEEGLRFDASAQIADWFLGQPEAVGALEEIGAGRLFSACVAESGSWLPALAAWGEAAHEVQLTERIAALSRTQKSGQNRKAIVAASLRTLIALASRPGAGVNQYADLVFDPGYFRYYPINLQSFAFACASDWAKMRMDALLRWLLIHWGIEVHLRVALRKLRGQMQSTFRIRPSDRGMEVIAVPPAVHTRPRFNQALRVLKDIGAFQRSASGAWQPSDFGEEMLELGDAA